MRLSEFSYHLPEYLIAQEPLQERTASRLMVADRSSGKWTHSLFTRLPQLLESGDVLVVNRSRVVPARLFVKRKTGGEVEVFYLHSFEEKTFSALVRPAAKIKIGETLTCPQGNFTLQVAKKKSTRVMELKVTSGQRIEEVLQSFGHVPLPPYISRPDTFADRSRYQTVYAREGGSVAAPTAGLHFSDSILDEIKSRGVDLHSVVLHVGPGTFLPLDDATVEKNTLHYERFSVDGATLAAIDTAKAEGRRVVAVGTTVTRVLESVFRQGLFESPPADGTLTAETNLFIYPGFEFQVVDKLLTNFHLPESSLILLVSAFFGREKTLACYEEAVKQAYRFFSYGDAMLIR
jgi:S-adenosylmethionine:tRNA ribosyltransferase-isomerase